MRKIPSIAKPSEERVLLVDVSNSFTKFALARNGVIGRISRVPTSSLAANGSGLFPKANRAVISSVVPAANPVLKKQLSCPGLWVNHSSAGVSIRYPSPTSIGADRLANAAAAVGLGKIPAIVVDFGTAVTFDIIDPEGCYLGGIIAPGLSTAASALHERTALLPLTKIQRISSPVGKSTQQAIRIGLLLGAVGIVREAVDRITREVFHGRKPTVLATGGDASLVSRLAAEGGKKLIDLVDPLLTLKGLLIIASREN